jgi:nucleotide-binding universal stress UspA family protein
MFRYILAPFGGPSARTIAGFGEEQNNDLIAIESRGLGPLEGVLLGRVSHMVTSLAKSPVLVV